MKFVVVFGMLVLHLSETKPAFAGAWLKKPGDGEFITTQSYHSASLGYDDLGNASEIIDFSKLETAIYGEYGVTRNWSVVGRLAVQDVSLTRTNSVDQNLGFGASQLAIKRKLPEFSSWVLSSQIGISIPGSTENGLDLRLGEGQIEWEARFLAGRSFVVVQKNGFIDIQISRKFRSANVPDEWRVDATAGLYPAKHVMLMAQVFRLQGDEAKFAGVRTLSSTRLQGSAVWFFTSKNGIQLYASKSVAGRNTIADTAIGIGWWRRF